ncbi:bacterial surface protein [Cohnella herbarum]|uniref:Bacterial surface protein n=1 Tax=Cohnella herbarum TaxID=2728023 RepID=A0A7Z2VRI2_9BACL|nr:bacterial surface protein [Cohnella herbarum]QJD87600.1 bacterial surface protein [Cohnella herbarum]
MNKINKKIVSIVLSAVMLFTFVSNASAAVVGDVLQNPETGWTRYDETDYNFIYTGESWGYTYDSAYYGGSIKIFVGTKGSVKFKFKGTKFRLIANYNTDRPNSESNKVIIDGEYDSAFSEFNSLNHQILVFEKTDLPDIEHNVEIDVNGLFSLDAIDIDDTGTILNPEDPEQPAQGNRALLTITMTNGLEKEYDLSMAEVNAFISWFDAKDAGSGPAKYKFVKTWNKGPFKSRAEYVIFDKILTFDVDEYDVTSP